MDVDSILEKFGVTYDKLTPNERETFNAMLAAMQESVLTVEKLRDYINAMKMGVEQELTKHDLGSKQDLFLKARLRNYMLLEAFLQTPVKAKQALENALRGYHS